MAKGQKRSNKEPKKLKDAARKQKKSEGPKYIRAAEGLAAGKLGAQRPGKLQR